MKTSRRHGGRAAFAMLAALAVGLPLALTACASREGAQQASRGMSRDRELARTPDQLDLDRPAWSRDLSPSADP